MVRVINGRKKFKEKKGSKEKGEKKPNCQRIGRGLEKPLPVLLTNFLMVKKARTVPEPVCRFS